MTRTNTECIKYLSHNSQNDFGYSEKKVVQIHS